MAPTRHAGTGDRASLPAPAKARRKDEAYAKAAKAGGQPDTITPTARYSASVWHAI